MRQVRFSSANAIYSPIPPTPSPTLSLSSLPSLSEPPTPLNLTPMLHLSPLPERKPSPEPEPSPGEMHIHFLLAFSPYEEPAIHYDLTLPPSLNNEITSEEFAEPATHPPLSSLLITCPHIPWPIIVSPSSGAGGFITILDVLECIYRALRTPVLLAEYGSLPSKDATLDVNTAYYRRCKRIEDFDARRLEEGKGVKRVDFLMGKNRFLGLSGTLKGPDIWELNVS